MEHFDFCRIPACPDVHVAFVQRWHYAPVYGHSWLFAGFIAVFPVLQVAPVRRIAAYRLLHGRSAQIGRHLVETPVETVLWVRVLLGGVGYAFQVVVPLFPVHRPKHGPFAAANLYKEGHRQPEYVYCVRKYFVVMLYFYLV